MENIYWNTYTNSSTSSSTSSSIANTDYSLIGNKNDFIEYKKIINNLFSSTSSSDNYYSLPLTTAASTATLFGNYYPYTASTTAFKTAFYWCDDYIPTRKTPQEKLRDILRERISPKICTRKHLKTPEDIREERARETLRRLIGDSKYKLFVKHGFVSVRQPKSGLTYQIFPGHGITQVYKNGQMVDRLCVVLKGNFPPTDSVIVRYLMILNNEEEFNKLAIKHSVVKKNEYNKIGEQLQPLSAIYARLKSA